MLALASAAIEDPDDQEFMIQFYLEYEQLMYATVRKWLMGPEVARDVVQGCIAKLIPKISFPRRQGRCIRASYTASTVRNITVSYMRRQGCTDNRCCSLEEREEQDMTIPRPSLNERIMLAEQKECLMQIWSSLPEEDRLLSEGKYILGYTDAELVNMLGYKESSVHTKLTRTQRRAFQFMTEEEGDKI